MRHFLKTYLHSFQPKKEHGYVLGTFLVFGAIIFLLFTIFSAYLKKQMGLLPHLSTPEQIQQLLMHLPAEQAQALVAQLKSLLLHTAGSLLLFIVLCWMLFAFSQAWIWHKLSHKNLRRKLFWKWNWLHALLLPAGIFFFLFFVLLRLALTVLFSVSFSGTEPLSILPALLNLAFLTFLLLFAFLASQSLVHSEKVFASMGEALHHLGKGKFWLSYLAVTITGALPFLISLLFPRKDFSAQTLLWVNIIITLLFLAWMQVYVAGSDRACSGE